MNCNVQLKRFTRFISIIFLFANMKYFNSSEPQKCGCHQVSIKHISLVTTTSFLIFDRFYTLRTCSPRMSLFLLHVATMSLGQWNVYYKRHEISFNVLANMRRCSCLITNKLYCNHEMWHIIIFIPTLFYLFG